MSRLNNNNNFFEIRLSKEILRGNIYFNYFTHEQKNKSKYEATLNMFSSIMCKSLSINILLSCHFNT